MDTFIAWCKSNTAAAKCTRTIVQGVIGVIVMYVPDLVAGCELVPSEYKAMGVAITMAILSPIQALIGGEDD